MASAPHGKKYIYIVCVSTYVNKHTRMSVKCVCACVPVRMKSARAHYFASKTENSEMEEEK